MAKAADQSSTLQRQQKPNVPKRKHRWSWRRKMRKEMQLLEAMAAEMRAELNHMKRANRKKMAKMRKLEMKNSEIRKNNQIAAMNDAENQLLVDALLPHVLND